MAHEELVYKTVGDVALRLCAFRPELRPADRPVPAIVFFFGGGWVSGNLEQFFPQCAYLASRGMTAFAAEYRVRDRHGVSPFECVADAKSAVRRLRAQARELGLDPARIAAGGCSAGGHIAACTGFIDGHDELGEESTVSSRADALVLLNPAFDLSRITATGHGAEALSAAQQRALSPIHHVRSGFPPTIIFHGTADKVTPFSVTERFVRLSCEAGNRCDLVASEGGEHGCFNYGLHENVPFVAMLEATDRFLGALGWLDGAPAVERWLAYAGSE